jgi:hypothetical protein
MNRSEASLTAKPGSNHTFSFRPTHETGFCWGSFGAIQELSLAVHRRITRQLVRDQYF